MNRMADGGLLYLLENSPAISFNPMLFKGIVS
jgi:hypothetical protein